jgi:Protein of unknown function (DUF3313)
MRSKATTADRVMMALAGLALLGGCASQEPRLESLETTAGPTAAATQPGEVAGRSAMVWRAPNLDPDWRPYTRVLLDPVEIYRGPDAAFGGADAQQQQQIAEYVWREYRRAIEPYAASAPGPGVVRLKIMLAGLENNVPVAATATRVVPVGLAVNLGRAAMGQPGTFTGGVVLAGQMVDAQTDQPLVTAVQKCYPPMLNVKATLSSREAQEAAIRDAAEAFRRRLIEIKGGE